MCVCVCARDHGNGVRRALDRRARRAFETWGRGGRGAGASILKLGWGGRGAGASIRKLGDGGDVWQGRAFETWVWGDVGRARAFENSGVGGTWGGGEGVWGNSLSSSLCPARQSSSLVPARRQETARELAVVLPCPGPARAHGAMRLVAVAAAGWRPLSRETGPDPSHWIRVARSESSDLTHQIRVTGSKSLDPSHQIRVTGSESLDPSHWIRVTRSESPDPSH